MKDYSKIGWLEGKYIEETNEILIEKARRVSEDLKRARDRFVNTRATNEVCSLLGNKFLQSCEVYSDRVDWHGLSDEGQIRFNGLGYENIGEIKLLPESEITRILDVNYLNRLHRPHISRIEIVLELDKRVNGICERVRQQCGIPIFRRYESPSNDGGIYCYVYSLRQFLAYEIGSRLIPNSYIEWGDGLIDPNNPHTKAYVKKPEPVKPTYKKWE